MNEAEIRKRMSEVLDLLNTDISAIRTGRASPGVVQDLEVSVYDGKQKLKVNELATISTQDTSSIIVDPWDKSVIGEINNGIIKANVGLNPVIDGEVIRIALPPLTTEDREKFIKLLAKKLESGRIMLRQIRGEVIKDTKDLFEKKEVTEDEKFSQEKHLQEITDEFVGRIDSVGETKKAELLSV